uniref:Uncharacterized protein n=1 Tax=Amphimedon queenslandica TaxID=400682 RepID=A0A1X7TPL7_AMPQE
MPEALPSLRTVQNVIYREYVPLREGYFRFDDLLQHLVKHKAPFMVALAEDATRIIKNAEHDAVSNTCVGFVLPVNRDGLPLRNSFNVNTFEDIESYFQQHTIAKYAYVYMVQSLKEGVPSFCLACIGSDNKFSATDVLQRWKYINKELSLRGVRVVSFAADGDSRLMRAMHVTTHLISNNTNLSLNNDTTPLPILQGNLSIKRWLFTNLYALFCVQDMVHVAVKFKTRLLKPSILLPMGDYIATSAHLHILTNIYGKEKHGMRRRDLDSRDKQNFAAIEHLMRASTLLENIPDAVGTKVYLEIVDASVNSYLDKSFFPKKRINDIWYAVFFLRYWREWIHQHRAFTIKDNFITSNCYTCVELNAHSLLAYVISIRDIYKAPECFTPWQMGSQSAEKIFQSLRSMQGTFPSIVNFTMLGMLQRLHKLAIKEDLESESERESHGIHLARLEGHKKKTGHGKVSPSDWNLTDECIFVALKEAEERGKSAVSKLGMADELKRVNKWEIPPKPSSIMSTWNDDDDDDEKEEYEIEHNGINEPNEAEDLKDIVSDLEKLHANNAIDNELLKKGQSMAKMVSIDIPSVAIPMYQNKMMTPDKDPNNSLFVPVIVKGRSIFIRKKNSSMATQ